MNKFVSRVNSSRGLPFLIHICFYGSMSRCWSAGLDTNDQILTLTSGFANAVKRQSIGYTLCVGSKRIGIRALTLMTAETSPRCEFLLPMKQIFHRAARLPRSRIQSCAQDM